MRIPALCLMFALATIPARAQFTLDFETTGQLQLEPTASGDLGNFIETTEQALSGVNSIRFTDSGPESFESFTYSDPTAMTTGTITVWFYDTTGFPAVGNPFTAQWGMSIILEDADNPADFGAIEICDLPYGNQGYYASEGTGDRLKPNDRFYSGLPGPRAIGWHRVDFEVGETISIIKVDGTAAIEVAAPGGEKNLRLRIMADSASVGGFDNWFTFAGGDSWPAQPGLVFVDDITFDETAPVAESARLDFEIDGETADFDTSGEFMGPEATNNPNMLGFVNTFDRATTTSHSGTNAAFFANGTAALRSVAFDLSAIDDSTTRVATVHFYDALGNDQGFDKIGGSVILQSGDDPTHWIAAEVWNAPYPFGDPTSNYYLTARPVPSGSGFYSRYFGDRSIGWHTVEVLMTAEGSRLILDGLEDQNNEGVITGPGLDDNPRLIIMADSPSLGGFASWTDPAGWVDPTSPELNTLYLEKTADYLYIDDIVLPRDVNAAANWSIYR